jgi:hypothetical protein
MILFIVLIILIVMLTAAAAYFALQKKTKDDEEGPTVYTSGIFSLVRQSPREILSKRKLSLTQIEEALKAPPPENVTGSAQSYLDLWINIIENSIEIIENGDKDGIQTYCYSDSSKNIDALGIIQKGTYVTREQLHNYPELIPPFYLGCNIKLIPKNAWNTNLDGTGWKPLLPVKGKYLTPDWRTVGKLDSQ